MYEEIFRNNFTSKNKKRIALYGTGVIANEITLTCFDYNIIGLIDRQMIGSVLNGTRIYDIYDLEKLDVEELIIAAQPQNISIIYYRIKNIVDSLEIKVFDIYGNELPNLEWKKKEYYSGTHCTEEDYKQLKKEIREHDIISFDIFDTLLMRLVFEPHDIFELVEIQAKKRKIYFGNFKEERIQAEVSLISKIPTLHELYAEFQRTTNLDENTIEELKNLEIEVEKKLLIPRKRVVELFLYARDMGKDVYIVTDMYMSTEFLEEILRCNGIDGFVKIFNSCDYHKPKVNGLYKVFLDEVLHREESRKERVLHIGDYYLADGESPRREGIDSWIIEKSSSLFEKSQFGELRQYMNGINERLIVGMWIGKIFNSPFCISDNKIVVDDVHDLAWAGVGTVFSTFVEWLRCQKTKFNEKVILSARDGWLIKKILENDDDYLYFYTSRLALKKCYAEKELFKNYERYIKKCKVSSSEEYLFFDLVSSGSCLLYLSDLFGLQLKGIFLCQYDKENPERKHLNIISMFDENGESNFRKYYLFFEMLLTATESSLSSFSNDGEPFFEEELRTQEEIELVLDLQQTLMEHHNIYGMFASDAFVNMDLLDGLLNIYNEELTEHVFKEKPLFCIYDSYGVGRISLY